MMPKRRNGHVGRHETAISRRVKVMYQALKDFKTRFAQLKHRNGDGVTIITQGCQLVSRSGQLVGVVRPVHNTEEALRSLE